MIRFELKGAILFFTVWTFQESYALTCMKSPEVSVPGITMPSENTCESGEICKNVTTKSGTVFSCDTTDLDMTDNANCATVSETTTCFCDVENCNQQGTSIKCSVGASSAKMETTCQTGIKNCKSVTVTTLGVGVATHSCGTTDKDQELTCEDAIGGATKTCYCAGPECSSSPKQMIINQLVIFLAMAAILGTQY